MAVKIVQVHSTHNMVVQTEDSLKVTNPKGVWVCSFCHYCQCHYPDVLYQPCRTSKER